MILERNIYYAGGAYMLRTSAFLKHIPTRKIFVSRGGQNWQMLLPVLYSNKCKYLHETLYFIIEHDDSHSRILKTYYQLLSRTYEHENILVNTIKTINEIPIEEKINYQKIIERKYHRKRFGLAVSFRKHAEAKRYLNDLKGDESLRFKDYLLYLSTHNLLFWNAGRIIRRVLIKIKQISLGKV
jgi:hypothetical protein